MTGLVLQQSEFIRHPTEDGRTRIEVRFEGESAWLSLNQMVELFQRDKSVISRRHIRNVFDEGELSSDLVPFDPLSRGATDDQCAKYPPRTSAFLALATRRRAARLLPGHTFNQMRVDSLLVEPEATDVETGLCSQTWYQHPTWQSALFQAGWGKGSQPFHQRLEENSKHCASIVIACPRRWGSAFFSKEAFLN